MNGRELARRMHERLPDLPVLFVSGYSADVLTDEVALDEHLHVLAKPYTLAELAQRVRDVLRGGREPGVGDAETGPGSS